jgi:hypothetical protein
VDDGWGDVAACDGDGSEEGCGLYGDAVALIGPDEIMGGVSVFGGVRKGRDGGVGF